MHNLINSHDPVHIKWMPWIKIAPDQKAVLLKVIKGGHEKDDPGYVKFRHT